MNILVMAGTSDASRLIKNLKNSKKDVYITATTVTDYGAQLAQEAGADRVLPKALPQHELTHILIDLNIDVLVDATHPFAAEATRNAIKAARKTQTKYLRLERPPLNLPDNELIHIVRSFQEAAQLAQKITDGPILHLAGVSTLFHLINIIDKGRIVARVLPSSYSINKCLELGLSGENIIAMQGTFSIEFNQALMKEYHAGVIITKESGESGGTISKIEAALKLKIPVIVVERPEIHELKKEKVKGSVEELLMELIK
ncbi:MAG TPA: precorrin-6A reductase [Methanobacteriaceae archaeon]|nr:precorrin-6A reductase [Methanobacteriaceae archaeon]